MVEYFGYSGSMKKQRQSITTLIETNFTEYENVLWWRYSNKDYEEFRNVQGYLPSEILGYDQSYPKEEQKSEEYLPSENPKDKKTIVLYPEIKTGKGVGTTKHLLVMPDMFREMLMLCKDRKGQTSKTLLYILS